MDINEATAKALQAARAVSGMTYEEIAEKSGVSAPTIYRMFGAKRDIKVPQLHAVAKVMGVTLVEVMQDAERIQSRDERNRGEAKGDVIDISQLPSEDRADLAVERFTRDQLTAAANKDPNKEREMEGDVHDF